MILKVPSNLIYSMSLWDLGNKDHQGYESTSDWGTIKLEVISLENSYLMEGRENNTDL